MKKFILLFSLPAIVLVMISCHRDSDQARNTITRRIQYDVNIKSPDQEMEWWVQNIEGASREKLLGNIFQQVKSGEVKAYDFFSCNLLSVEDVNNLMRRVDSISVQSPIPPYELIDTVVVQELRLSDITKLRFLEEWGMDDKSLAFTKKIAGICPLTEKHTETGELLGYRPLFWVFFDKKYPAELKNK